MSVKCTCVIQTDTFSGSARASRNIDASMRRLIYLTHNSIRFLERKTMRQRMFLTLVLLLLVPMLLTAQQGAPIPPAAPAAPAAGVQGGVPGGQRGPSGPANVLSRVMTTATNICRNCPGCACRIAFVGDSITDGWRNAGQPIWDSNLRPTSQPISASAGTRPRACCGGCRMANWNDIRRS